MLHKSTNYVLDRRVHPIVFVLRKVFQVMSKVLEIFTNGANGFLSGEDVFPSTSQTSSPESVRLPVRVSPAIIESTGARIATHNQQEGNGNREDSPHDDCSE